MKYPLKKVSSIISATLFGFAISTTASSVNNQANLGQLDIVSEQESATSNVFRPTQRLPERYIIKYKNDNSAQQAAGNSTQSAGLSTLSSVKSKAKGLGIKIAQEFANVRVLTAQLSQNEVASLRADANIEYVEVDQPRRFMAQIQPYGIGMVQADLVDDSVAAASAGGKKVCIIDSGLDLPHEDMGSQGASINGTNDSGTGNWYEHGGTHGTHVAGTIGALNNGLGVRGVIGSDVDMHIVKVFNEAGWGYSSSLASAITTCANNGADVVNMSLGGSGSNTTEQNALQALYDDGVLLIAAAGNDGVATNTTDALSYPASYDSVMSVAAIDSAKVLADFSQKNSQVEIAGPGVDVLSTYPMGTGSVTELTVGATAYSVNGMENQGAASGALFNFSTGESTNSGASGKVCLIQRGNISFHDKVKNCQDSGGVGAIIYNNVAGALGATLGDTNTTSIPSVSASQADGNAMLSQIGSTTNINIGAGNYNKISGTSMASPHVAGVATLVWSHHPSCTNVEIRNALNATAEDLGNAGRDVKFGYGLVQTKAAIDYIAANGCDGSGSGGGGGGTTNLLTNGVAVTSLAANKGSQVAYTMEVPAGATDLSFAISGGSGDADMYVKFGSAPTTASYDCRPYKSGNSESCPISNVQAGTYHIMLDGYSALSGVSLTGSYTEAGAGGGAASYTNSANANIPDNNSTGITSSITATRTGASNSVFVDVAIVHTYIGDLTVDLIHPDGTVYNLHNKTGGSANNINQSYTVEAGSKNSAGTWNLRVRDSARQDTGYIDSWTISFQ